MSSISTDLKAYFAKAQKAGLPLKDFKDFENFIKEVASMEKGLAEFEKQAEALKKLRARLESAMNAINKKCRNWDKQLHDLKKNLPNNKDAQGFFQRMNVLLNQLETVSDPKRNQALDPV